MRAQLPRRAEVAYRHYFFALQLVGADAAHFQLQNHGISAR